MHLAWDAVDAELHDYAGPRNPNRSRTSSQAQTVVRIAMIKASAGMFWNPCSRDGVVMVGFGDNSDVSRSVV